ncbi:hypothetical protein CVS28_09010 [Arthrobacter glacialis]|nr:YchJ family metal-binding protein [Arthrobacter glacialis]POH58845.1 hypothetical protein CVS28_09010 [Arthrobacter glacialis]
MRCPCQSGELFESCCAKYLESTAGGQRSFPPTAEALMRSRFSAFALGDAGYLLHTWHPSTRPESLELDPDQQWYLLEILSTRQGGYFDQEGVVTFRAHYRSAANRKIKDSLTETSSFVRDGKQWLYVDALEFH